MNLTEKTKLNVSLNKITLFCVDEKYITNEGKIFSFEEFIRSEKEYFVSPEDFSIIISKYLISLYPEKNVENLFENICDYVKINGSIFNRGFLNIDLKFKCYNPEKIENLEPSFEFLYGDYLAGNVNSVFIAKCRKICYDHFLYMTIGSFNAIFTSSFGLRDSVPDALENLFDFENAKSVLDLLKKPYFDILWDIKVPIEFDGKDSEKVSEYLLENLGKEKIKEFWNILLSKRIPAYLYRNYDKDFTNKMFKERLVAIESQNFEYFIKSDTGLIFSILYSNVPYFRSSYNRGLITFFKESEPIWRL
jgi:hypothetical protein